MAGDSGKIFTSTDSGRTLELETSTATENLNDVFMLSSSQGSAVGASGRILRFSVSAPITPQSVVIPEAQGSLKAINNLVDPSKGEATTVQYAQKKAGKVTVTVHTMQGLKLRTLLDEARAAGTYSDLNWDGKNDSGETVASGIYLLHIEGPEFSISRKIAVVR